MTHPSKLNESVSRMKEVHFYWAIISVDLHAPKIFEPKDLFLFLVSMANCSGFPKGETVDSL